MPVLLLCIPSQGMILSPEEGQGSVCCHGRDGEALVPGEGLPEEGQLLREGPFPCGIASVPVALPQFLPPAFLQKSCSSATLLQGSNIVRGESDAGGESNLVKVLPREGQTLGEGPFPCRIDSAPAAPP